MINDNTKINTLRKVQSIVGVVAGGAGGGTVVDIEYQTECSNFILRITTIRCGNRWVVAEEIHAEPVVVVSIAVYHPYGALNRVGEADRPIQHILPKKA